MKLYSIYDKKALNYSFPFVSANDATAVRQFTHSVNDPSTVLLNQYPADYDLVYVGSFDENDGLFNSIKVFIVNGLSVKNTGDEK